MPKPTPISRSRAVRASREPTVYGPRVAVKPRADQMRVDRKFAGELKEQAAQGHLDHAAGFLTDAEIELGYGDFKSVVTNLRAARVALGMAERLLKGARA